MNNRQRVLAVLNYQSYDRLPLAHFGFWDETLEIWARQGHITRELAKAWGDGNPADAEITAQLGFDLNYYCCFHPATGMRPHFPHRVMQEFPDGSRHVLNPVGVVVLDRPGTQGIPTEIEHIFHGRKEWEEQFRHRFRFSPDRVTRQPVLMNGRMVPFDEGGREFLQADQRDYLYGLHCGSLYGDIRNFIGMENSCYLWQDDEALMVEIIDAVAEVSYQCTKAALESGAKFDFGHFWEDICFKSGPLISPSVFQARVAPHYRRITALLGQHGIDIVSLDCDGCIDALLPIWLVNGVNTMFPIEVGTWGASIEPWRKKWGRELRGVGGMNKVLFARDRSAIDAEIERLKPLVDLGGYLPCPDHRIAPDGIWDNVRYYCDRMRKAFGG
jgi:uroporphyrinogen decarboxylase